MTSLTTIQKPPKISRILKQFHDYLFNLFPISVCVYLWVCIHGPDSAIVSAQMQQSGYKDLVAGFNSTIACLIYHSWDHIHPLPTQRKVFAAMQSHTFFYSTERININFFFNLFTLFLYTYILIPGAQMPQQRGKIILMFC